MALPDLHISPDVPIACSLSSTDFRQRQRDIANLASAALLSRAPIHGGERLVFEADGDTRRQLERLVAAEAQCCPFLIMDLRPNGDRVVLDVTGRVDALTMIGELFA